MRKTILLLFVCGSLQYTFAQVGINTLTPQALLHIDGAKDNNINGQPTVQQSKNDVVITSAGNIGVGTLTPVVRLDTRSTQNTDNSIGIGQTTKAASVAGAGAIRYNTFNGGKMQYSDGTKWEDLLSVPVKAIVVSNIQAANFAIKIPYLVQTAVQNWTTLTDATGNFDSTSGTFTAPRTGIYLVSFTYDFVRIPLISPYYSEAQFVVNGTNIAKKCTKSHQNANIQAQVGSVCTAGIMLNRGDTLQPMIYQGVYNGQLSLRTGQPGTASNDDYGFINLSIMEQ